MTREFDTSARQERIKNLTQRIKADDLIMGVGLFTGLGALNLLQEQIGNQALLEEAANLSIIPQFGAIIAEVHNIFKLRQLQKEQYEETLIELRKRVRILPEEIFADLWNNLQNIRQATEGVAGSFKKSRANLFDAVYQVFEDHAQKKK